MDRTRLSERCLLTPKPTDLCHSAGPAFLSCVRCRRSSRLCSSPLLHVTNPRGPAALGRPWESPGVMPGGRGRFGHLGGLWAGNSAVATKMLRRGAAGVLSYGRSRLLRKVTYMTTETSRFLAAPLDSYTIKGFQCAAGDFLGAQTSIAGHIRAIWPPLLVGSSRLAVKVERHPRVIGRPPVRPKAKRLPSTGPANTAAGRCITLDRRTGPE